MTYSDPKVTYIDPSHILLPLPTSPDPYLAQSWRLKDLRWVEGGGGSQILCKAPGKGYRQLTIKH